MRIPHQGFTLLELLTVIAVVGILAAVMIPNLLRARERAFDTAAGTCARQIAASQEIAFIGTLGYFDSYSALVVAVAGVTDNCEAGWVDDSAAFSIGWGVQHPQGSGLVYMVGPGGIIPPP